MRAHEEVDCASVEPVSGGQEQREQRELKKLQRQQQREQDLRRWHEQMEQAGLERQERQQQREQRQLEKKHCSTTTPALSFTTTRAW
jgi:hypothetical protein